MDFQLTEDRRMLADTLNRFVAEQYSFATRTAIAQSAQGWSRAHWERFAELGILGALFSPGHGGYGGEGFDTTVVFECLGRGLVVEPLLGTLVVGQALARAGTVAQQELLAQLIDGSALAALAHDEPGGHYEMDRVDTQAVRTAEGWTLSGAKAVVQQGEAADWFLVTARSAADAQGEAGISLFLVPAGAAGLRLRGYPKVDGGRAAELFLDRVCVGPEALLGAQGAGFDTLEYAMGWGVLALCAEAVGAMEVAKEATLEYLRTRKQFGVVIGSFQALQHRMADVLLEVEQARSAVINAAAHMAAPRLQRERSLSAAKYSIGRIGVRVAEECIQLHGGIGMTWELPMAHYAKRLVLVDHQFGDEDHHLERYISLGRSH